MSNILTVVFRESSEVPESEHSLSFRELWAFYIVCLRFPLHWAALWPIKHPRMPLEDKLQSSYLGAVKMSFNSFKGPLYSGLQICFQSLQQQMMMKLCMVQSLGWIHSSEHFYRGFLGWGLVPIHGKAHCLFPTTFPCIKAILWRDWIIIHVTVSYLNLFLSHWDPSLQAQLSA